MRGKFIIGGAMVATACAIAAPASATSASATPSSACQDGRVLVTFDIYNEYPRPLTIAGYGLLANQPPAVLAPHGRTSWPVVVSTSGTFRWGINYAEPGTGAQVTSTGNRDIVVDVAPCSTTTTTATEATTTTSSPVATTVAPTTVPLPSSVATVATVPRSATSVLEISEETMVARPTGQPVLLAQPVLPATGLGTDGMKVAVVAVLAGAILVLAAHRRPT
jgi:hypothetical protein